MTVESYEDATALITILNKVLALRNFVDPRKNKCKFICCLIYTTLVISLPILFIYAQVQLVSMIASNIKKLLHLFVVFTTSFAYLTILIIGLYNSKAALELTSQIRNVDEKLKMLGVRIDYRGLFHRVIIIAFFWTLNLIVVIGVCVYDLLTDKFNLIAFCISFIYVLFVYTGSIVLYDFKMVIYWLGLKFEQTNELLATFLPEDYQTKVTNRNAKITVQPALNFRDRVQLCRGLFGKVHALEQIRLVHLQLCVITKKLNQIFQMQILLFVFIAVYYLTVVFYNVYIEFIKIKQSVEVRSMYLMFISDAVYTFIKIVVVSHSCEYTVSQANKAIDIIHTCSRYNEDPDLKDEILQFCLQMSYMQSGKLKPRPPSFWFDYGFVRQCIGNVLTTLIIMIQWNDVTKIGNSTTAGNETNHA